MSKKIYTKKIESQKDLIISILKSAPYGILTLKSIRNIEGRIIDFEFIMVNKKFEDLIGRNGKDLIGKRFLEVFKRKIWSEEFELFLNYSMQEDYFELEKAFQVKRKTRCFLISGIHFDDALTLHFIDITDFKDNIRAITEKENKYRVLFEESIDPVFVLNDSFTIIDFNRPFSKEFGFKNNDRGKASLLDLMKDSDKVELFKRQLDNDNKFPVQMELLLPDKVGDSRECIIHCAHLIQQIRDKSIYINVIRDITERKKAEKEMIFAEKMATTGKLARIIAHELRNPLTNINLALSEMEEVIEPISKEAKYYFDMIKRNTERIQTLTRDFLNSSKSKSLALEKRDINLIVGETLEFIRDRLALKGMILKEKLDSGLPLMNIDPDQIKAGLLNLFLNAVEAMEPGKGVLEISTRLDDYNVSISIKDNGRGINQHDLDLIFDPFYSGKNEGTGLGLTVTKNIISSHKGNISVESREGQGTLFTVTLPVSR